MICTSTRSLHSPSRSSTSPRAAEARRVSSHRRNARRRCGCDSPVGLGLRALRIACSCDECRPAKAGSRPTRPGRERLHPCGCHCFRANNPGLRPSSASCLRVRGRERSEACLGVAALAAGLGLAQILPAVQAALCVAGFGRSLFVALRGTAQPCSVLATGWFVWGGFILLNRFLENYFYLSLGFAAAGLAVGASRDLSACKTLSTAAAG